VLASGNAQGLPNGLLHARNLRMGTNIQFGKAGGGLWVDGIVCIGQDAGSDEAGGTYYAHNKPKGIFYTESNFSHVTGPLVKVTLSRNIVLDDVGGDLFREPRAIFNVLAHDHGVSGASEVHSDFVQWYHDNEFSENFIFYNVRSYDSGEVQGIYHDDPGGTEQFNNIAIVNLHIDRIDGVEGTGQWTNLHTDHFLLWHVTHDNLPFAINTPHVTNLSVRGCAWDKLTMSPANAELYEASFFDNHFVDTTTWHSFAGGTNYTTGNPMWANPAENNYRPGENSPLLDRVNPILATSDATGEPRHPPASAGAFDIKNDTLAPCVADISGNDVVEVDDMLAVISNWGGCADCAADIAPEGGDGIVDVDDLLEIINNWGACE
jgi:hypothetical protein